METYYFKRYRRSSPAATTDTLQFSADRTVHAKGIVKRYLDSGLLPMHLDTHFGTLEDVSGKVLETWPGS
jgi:hypothetical protein